MHPFIDTTPTFDFIHHTKWKWEIRKQCFANESMLIFDFTLCSLYFINSPVFFLLFLLLFVFFSAKLKYAHNDTRWDIYTKNIPEDEERLTTDEYDDEKNKTVSNEMLWRLFQCNLHWCNFVEKKKKFASNCFSKFSLFLFFDRELHFQLIHFMVLRLCVTNSHWGIYFFFLLLTQYLETHKIVSLNILSVLAHTRY